MKIPNVILAVNTPRQALQSSLIAGFFMPVDYCHQYALVSVISGVGYGFALGNKGLITPNTKALNLDRRKPSSIALGTTIAATQNGALPNAILETIMSKQITAEFHDTTLNIIEHNGQPFISAKQISEAIGLKWEPQYTKLNHNRSRWSITKIVMVAQDGKQRSTVCMPLRKLPGWLMTIQPNKLSNELRPKIIQYQTECDGVLWAHWEQSITQAHTPALAEQQTLPVISNQRITVVTVIENGAAVSTKTFNSETVVLERAHLQDMLKKFRDAQYHAAHVTSMTAQELEKSIQ